MPIKISNELPAKSFLEQENVFVMTEDRANSQDIRPLKILILNLMPTKIATEIYDITQYIVELCKNMFTILAIITPHSPIIINEPIDVKSFLVV